MNSTAEELRPELQMHLWVSSEICLNIATADIGNSSLKLLETGLEIVRMHILYQN